MEKRKLSLFSKIHDIDDALKMIKDSAYGFYFIAALQGGIGFFLDPDLVIDAVLYLVLAFFLHKFKSRIASVLLLLITGLSLFSTFQNKFAGGAEGGSNIFLAFIMLGVAVRAVEATFKYQKYRKPAA